MIDRNIFLEYTRKMSLQKHCLYRLHIANFKAKKAADSFLTSFGNARMPLQTKELAIAKQIPFSKNLKEKSFSKKDEKYQQLLEGLLQSELKNEKLNNVVAEVVAEKSKNIQQVHFYYGAYEVPQKRIYEQGSSSSLTENESGEVYYHIICAMLDKSGNVVHGFLYPAYMEERYGDKERYDYF